MNREILEVEKKFYSPKDANQIIKKIQDLGYTFVEDTLEQDTYFTDVAGQYIRDRTCLRIRLIENLAGKRFEFTFKPKSETLGASYSKIEENVPLSGELEKTKKIQELNEQGFFVYVNFTKKRSVYTKQKDGLTFNILLDRLTNLGNFLEFEILAPVEQTSNLEQKLNSMIAAFSEFDLREADKPYRDFVAQYLHNQISQESSTLKIPITSRNNIDPRIEQICAQNGLHLSFCELKQLDHSDFFTYFQDINQLLLVAMYAK